MLVGAMRIPTDNEILFKILKETLDRSRLIESTDVSVTEFSLTLFLLGCLGPSMPEWGEGGDLGLLYNF